MDDPGAKKVVVPRRAKRVERVQNHSRTSMSRMVYGSANGGLLPPMMVVYKAQNLSCYRMLKEPEHQMRPLLSRETINLASHFSPNVIAVCKGKQIYMAPFPVNATHLMQLLDVAVFGPMKRKWREILDRWRKESRFLGCLPKEQFPNLLSRLWNGISATVGQNLISGFKATGLFPLNPQEVLKRIPDGIFDVDDKLKDNWMRV
ncbi:hypothetical protein NQ314_001130 [Rhamnusium bicolor]|uniref:DDE-1 domain-containing protein n=1 Tax=Rhamnusium bicolor TaxID=1586634 RepID=A0AAV8ZT48_9CUCU|nr:hypothetical protein NQ314_001130 [Rhamnusium bicolor]